MSGKETGEGRIEPDRCRARSFGREELVVGGCVDCQCIGLVGVAKIFLW